MHIYPEYISYCTGNAFRYSRKYSDNNSLVVSGMRSYPVKESNIALEDIYSYVLKFGSVSNSLDMDKLY